MTWDVIHGDCLEVMREMPDASVDAVVTDPPYGLEFMGKEWDSFRSDDTGTNRHRGDKAGTKGAKGGEERWGKGGNTIPSRRTSFGGGDRPRTYRCVNCGKRDQFRNPHACGEAVVWKQELIDPYAAPPTMLAYQNWCHEWARESLRVLRPGGHLLAFGGTRTSHRMACAIEDAGFEIRDTLAYLYGSGFPKSHNLNKLRGSVFCGCATAAAVVPLEHGQSTAEHHLRPLRDADLPAALDVDHQRGEVLLTSMSQPSTPINRTTGTATEDAWGEQPGMEGRRNLLAQEGQLSADQVCAGAGLGVTDGASGRIPDGASVVHGTTDRQTPGAAGSGASSRPQSAEQRPHESGTLARQWEPQASGAWPICPRCGLPAIPDGLGTALKPAHEPITLARKPLAEPTVAANVLRHATGAVNVDGCRIGDVSTVRSNRADMGYHGGLAAAGTGYSTGSASGRWPANVLLDQDAAGLLDAQSGQRTSGKMQPTHTTAERTVYGPNATGDYTTMETYGDTGGASRFFYCAKASRAERTCGGTVECAHPTVKPIALMRWLCRLVTPPGGVILDPFTGSGSTGCAAIAEGFGFIGIEQDAEYVRYAVNRIAYHATQAKQLTMAAD